MFRKMAATLIVAFATFSMAKAEDASKLALAVPAEVTEVATAGSWADGEASGVFRAIVLTTPSGEFNPGAHDRAVADLGHRREPEQGP